MVMSPYDEALSAAQRLDPVDQLRLAEKLMASARQQLATSRPRSIRELRGLGQGVWEGRDAQDYVNEERDAWRG